MVVVNKWLKQLGTPSQDGTWEDGVAIDSSGNVYLAGYTEGSLSGPQAGNGDAFLAKYDSSGNLLWMRQLGTTQYEWYENVATDSFGNAYISGATYGSLGGPLAGADDTFLAKYDSNGMLLWKRQLGGSSWDGSRSVATDSSGNAYIVGETGNSLGGSGSLVGNIDAWIGKYSSNGTLLWTKQLGTTVYDGASDVVIDNSGNIYISGWTEGSLGGTSAGGIDAWVAKYNSSGTRLWTKQLGTSADDQSWSIATDAAGNVYLTGLTSGNLGGINAGGDDAWVAKYNPNGNLLWTRQLGTFVDDQAFGIAVTDNGKVYISGWTNGNLGGTNAGGQDAWFAQYDTNGTLFRIQQMGTASNDDSNSIAVDNSGHLYLAGGTSGSLGGINAGQGDAWVAKYNVELPTFGNSTYYLTTATTWEKAEAQAVAMGGHLVTVNSLQEHQFLLNTFDRAESFWIGLTDQAQEGVFHWISGEPVTFTNWASTEPNNVNNEDYTAMNQFRRDAWNDLNGTALLRGIVEISPKITLAVTPSSVAENGTNQLVYTFTRQGLTTNSLTVNYIVGGTATFNSDYTQIGASTFTNTNGTVTFAAGAHTVTVTIDPAGDTTLESNETVILTLAAGAGYTIVGTTTTVTGTITNDDYGFGFVQFGTSSNDYADGISTDSNGNIYVTGYTDGLMPGNTHQSDFDAFIAKYNADGTQAWVKPLGTSDDDGALGIRTDSSGNSYVTGITNGSLPGNTHQGDFDAFIAKYNADGTQAWVKQLGTSNYDYASGISTDSSGNSYVTGYTNGSLPGYTNQGDFDVFIAKYKADGTQAWVKQLGTSYSDVAYSISTDSSGNSYVTGYTNGSLPGYTNQGDFDAFIAKYNADGTQAWVKQFGTSYSDVADGISTDSSGNSYVTGFTHGSLLGNTHQGNFDAFIAVFDTNSNLITNPLVVTNTHDSGTGTLRAAIDYANTNAVVDKISFNIPTTDLGYNPTTGAFTIKPLSSLPDITDAVVIDGTTQPRFSNNPIIELDGSSAGNSNGLIISAGDSTVRGLVVNRFAGNGIVLNIKGNNIIEGNYIGMDVTGTVDYGNNGSGIRIQTSNNRIGGTQTGSRNIISGSNIGDGILIVGGAGNQILGNYIGTDITGAIAIGNTNGVVIDNAPNTIIGGTDPGSRNVISGNNSNGIAIIFEGSTGTSILGNYIGTNASGTASLANQANGISVGSNANNIIIGGTETGAGNLISGNNLSGVLITGLTSQGNSQGNSILGNSIFGNGGLGIDLANGVFQGDGVTPNDLGDGDTGANNLQNHPVLTYATSNASNTNILGTFNSKPNNTLRLEFFANSTLDTSGYGEGQTFLGTSDVTTDASGNAAINK
jgi:Lectin C-type domain/Beta-propeller repeat